LKVLLTSLLFIYTAAFSQNVNREIIVLDSLFLKHTTEKKINILSNSDVYLLFQPDLDIPKSSLDDSIYKLKSSIYKRDLGLDFNSNIVNNQQIDIVNLDDNLPFKSRIQSGIEWNLLKNGLFQNKREAKKILIEQKINNQLSNNFLDKNTYLESYNNIIKLFNEKKIILLNSRQKMLSTFNGSLSRLYISNTIKQEEWLEVQQRLAENKSLLQIYQPYNAIQNTNSSKTNLTFPIFDINEQELMKYQNSLQKDSLEYYFNQINKLSDNWLSTVNLSPFTRYNYYNLINGSSASYRAFFSVGANLSIPLDFNRSKIKTLHELESKQKIQSIENQHQFYFEELANNLYEYRYNLYQLTSIYYKRKIIEDAISIENIKRELNRANFSPIKACKLIDDLYRIDLELIELNQNLYLKLLKIHKKNDLIPMEKLLKPFDFSSLNPKDSLNKKSIYIWSKTFKAYSSEILFQYIKTNQLNNVVLSIQEDSIDNQNQFCRILSENNIGVEIMIGNNKTFNEKDFQQFLNTKLSKVDIKSINGIHLDIEPHTFPDWKDKKSDYLSKYIELVKQASSFAKEKKIKLAISIPLTYPEEVVNELFKNVDLIYFMAYENVKEDYLSRKLLNFEKDKEKIVIAFRTEDFENRDQMDLFISSFQNKYDYKKIAIHDLGRLILLDSK
jgi:hypothetical protein